MAEMILTLTFCFGGISALVIVCAAIERLAQYLKERFGMKYTPIEYLGHKMFDSE